MQLLPASVLIGAFAVAVVGCKKDRSEVAPPAAVAQSASAAPSSSAAGDEAERLCGAKSICPNEPVDDEGTMLCASLGRDPICGAKFLTLVKCQIAKEKCGADGKIDQVATLDLCKLEDTALRDCEQAKAAAAKASAK
ncbi:MAG: hypothetical protein ACXVEF_40565 [Polyangiales bacterium]